MTQWSFDAILSQNPHLDRAKLDEIARLRDAVRDAGVRDNTYGLSQHQSGKSLPQTEANPKQEKHHPISI